MVTVNAAPDQPTAARLPMTTTDYPVLFESADRAAASGYRNYIRLVGLDLLLLLSGAGLSTFAPLLPNTSNKLVHAISAALLTAGFIAKSANRIRRFDADWFDGRAVAESIKTSTWRFMMRVPPFNGVDRDAEMALIGESRAILGARPHLIPELALKSSEPAQITPRMREIRSGSLLERKQTYTEQRLDDQIRWYATKAEANRRRAALWFWAGLLSQTAAIALTIVRIEFSGGPDLVALVAAVAATATAWTQVGRHDELGKSYGVAAQELILARGLLDLADDEETFSRSVIESENSISREHTMWAAKRR